MTGRSATHPCLAFLGVLILALGVGSQPPARAMMETTAGQAFMVDAETGTVLLEKNADLLVPPSSMSKLMTVYMVFERLKSGALSMEDRFLVSEKAWRKGGSKMFVEVGDRVSVADLLRGIIVQSGNDATIVIAEALAGSEEAFADQMTTRGRELGLENSTFMNASGWPHEDHRMTVRDIAILSQRLIENFPEYYQLYSERSFTYAGISQQNRNPLLNRLPGADGLKTGHTSAAGFGLAASAKQDGRRQILVLNGLESENRRAAESVRLMEWGFREFRNYSLLSEGEVVGEAPVWLGTQDTVPLVADRDVVVTLPRQARRTATVTMSFHGPVAAPISAGAHVADLIVTAPGMAPVTLPLLAGQDVGRLGFAGRISAALGHLLWGG